MKRNPATVCTAMQRNHCLLTTLAVLILTGPPSVPATHSNSTMEAETVSYCQLLKAPTTFDGKLIRITAVYLYSFEVQRLLPSSCCENRDPKTWVEFGELDRKSRKLASRFPKGTGMVLATFVGRLGHSPNPLGAKFTLTITAVENVERVAKGSEIKKAAWAPPFCGQ